LLAGRRDLIEAARANGNPHAGVGRGMKVSKEAMAGLWVALDRFLEADHDAEHRVHLAEAETIAAALADRGDARCQIEADWEDWPAPVIRVFPLLDRWRATDVRDCLQAGDPSVHVTAERDGLLISTHSLAPGEAETIATRLVAALDGVGENRP
jgi:L-seryl-tRNA(Ser) seleniumtransferase